MPSVVAVLVLEPVPVFELAVPCEVFGLDRTGDGVPAFDFRVCGVEERAIRTTGGFTMTPSHGLDGLRGADLVIVPGWAGADQPAPTAALRALRRAHARGARVASFCSGAFVLAEAGLLDGHRAATHWRYADRLACRHPAVEVDADVLYVDEDPLFTSAGTAAAIDLCLHLVRRDHGPSAANAIARRMVVPPHRDGGQSQYVLAPLPTSEEHDDIGPVLAWAQRHLDRDLTVEQLARRARLSPRTFARRFKDATGTTPLQWLLRQRVAEAQRLLEGTDLPVERIATRCGLGTAANLRLHFGRVVGTSPTAYRATFRRTA